MKLQRLAFPVFLIAFLISCDSGPKVIESVSQEPPAASEDSRTPVSLPGAPTVTDNQQQVHKVVVKDVLETERYSYLQVTEEDTGEGYWVAITKRPVEKGKTYFFRGGLLKRNFFSPEFNRFFDTLYLVSDFRQSFSNASPEEIQEALKKLQSEQPLEVSGDEEIRLAPGSIPLKDLFADMESFAGRTVQVTGKVIKVNPMIMGRNWVHIQDGTVEGKDLTITTLQNVPLGHVLTFEGTIALNRDFGAGYRYDIILEGATLK